MLNLIWGTETGEEIGFGEHMNQSFHTRRTWNQKWEAEFFFFSSLESFCFPSVSLNPSEKLLSPHPPPPYCPTMPVFVKSGVVCQLVQIWDVKMIYIRRNSCTLFIVGKKSKDLTLTYHRIICWSYIHLKNHFHFFALNQPQSWEVTQWGNPWSSEGVSWAQWSWHFVNTKRSK